MHVRHKVRAAVTAALLLFVFGSLMPALSWAGTFQVVPVRVELSSQQTSDALRVQNNGIEPIVIQLQAVVWSQDNGRDVYQPSDDLVATPPIFTIPPGATQIVRVGLLRGADEDRELSYRLYLQEVPPPPKPDFKGLQMALRIGLPVFVQPKVKASPKLNWRVEQASKSQLIVGLKNEGNAHIQVTDFSVFLPGKEQAMAVQQVSAYLLPGQDRSWTLATDSAQPLRSDTVHVKAYTDVGNVETDAKLEKP